MRQVLGDRRRSCEDLTYADVQEVSRRIRVEEERQLRYRYKNCESYRDVITHVHDVIMNEGETSDTLVIYINCSSGCLYSLV